MILARCIVSFGDCIQLLTVEASPMLPKLGDSFLSLTARVVWITETAETLAWLDKDRRREI